MSIASMSGRKCFYSSTPKAYPWFSLSRNGSHDKHWPQRGLGHPVEHFQPFVRETGKEGGCWEQLSGTPWPSLSAAEKPLITYFYFLSVSCVTKQKIYIKTMIAVYIFK